MAFERFSSIDSLLRANSSRPMNKAFAGSGKHSSDKKGSSFSGTASYEEAENLIATGWDEPLSKLKDFRKSGVKTNTQAQRRIPATGIVGYAPCVPNAIIGLPNSMISTETTKQKVKAVTLVYSPCVSAGWSTDEIIESGITVLNIVNSLELQGIRVRLTVEAMSTIEDKDLSTVWVDVKDWREAIDVKKTAFPLVHPSMLRRIGFRWLETFEQVSNRSYTFGYGTPLGNEKYEEVLKVLREAKVLEENEYYINAQLCRDCRNDMDKVMDKAGMSSLKQQRKGA